MRLSVFLVVALMIAYGSLYPFAFSSADDESWRTLFSNFRLFTSRGDVLGNFLLFIPLGTLGMLAFLPVIGQGASSFSVCLGGIVFAFALQVAQLYLPSRDAVLSDVIWNAIGLVAGIAAAPLVQRVADAKNSQPAVPLLLLLALWFAHELAPLLPSLDWQKVKDAIKPLFLNPHFDFANFVEHFAGALFAGLVLSGIVGNAASLRALIICVLFVLVGKIVVVSQALSLAAVGGFALACFSWEKLRCSPACDHIIAISLLLAVALAALDPLTFRVPPSDFNWLPFAGQLEGTMLINLGALLQKVFLYAAILWLAGTLGMSFWLSSACLAALVLLFETAQMFIPGRTADASEALWVLLTALALRTLPSRAKASFRAPGSSQDSCPRAHKRPEGR